MKRLIPLSLLIFVTAAAVFYSATHNLGVFKKTWKQTDLGIPTADIYNTKQLISRNPWDMTLYNGKLYVGNGDYDANTGPATVIYYDLEASEWKNEGKINDEAVQRFVTLNSELIILGIDPKDSQDFGSYYRQDDSGKWQSVRTVPYGVHMFDLVSFENSLYYAIGTAKYNQSPVQKTLDGKSFENVPFYDGEKALLSDENSGFSRCYGLFEVENKLYTFCRWSKAKTFGFFEYDGNAFRLLTKIDNKNFTDINKRSVYLPDGIWTDWHTCARIVGGKWMDIVADLDILPLYVREGSVIPVGPRMNYVNEKSIDSLEIRVYPFENEGRTQIDAETFDTVIPIVYEAKNGNHTVHIPETDINLTVKCMNNSTIKVVKNQQN